MVLDDPGFHPFDPALLRRIEDAGLNASAPAQQRWLDGWLVRFNPGKAKRARCIQPVAPGARPVADKLAECVALYRHLGLAPLARITPYSVPSDLDATLAALGWRVEDESLVMVLADLRGPAGVSARAWRDHRPSGLTEAVEDPRAYAQAVGALRGSPPEEIAAHAERLQTSPVSYTGVVWRAADGVVQACGQIAVEDDLAGLYDVATAATARGRGLATALCSGLLERAVGQGARTAYLQVDAGNGPALRVYHRLGFASAYRYHYRVA
jgi:GNAT superfamily N-acetyltransferase